MAEEYNPESDIKGRIEQLLLEIKELKQRRDRAKDAESAEVLDQQIKDLEDQVEFLRRQSPRFLQRPFDEKIERLSSCQHKN